MNEKQTNKHVFTQNAFHLKTFPCLDLYLSLVLANIILCVCVKYFILNNHQREPVSPYKLYLNILADDPLLFGVKYAHISLVV